jgi:hypothetical protein
MGYCFITLREPCNNQRPICIMSWLHVTNHLYHGFRVRLFNRLTQKTGPPHNVSCVHVALSLFFCVNVLLVIVWVYFGTFSFSHSIISSSSITPLVPSTCLCLSCLWLLRKSSHQLIMHNSWLITRFVTILTRRVPLVEQELLTLLSTCVHHSA